ncbi:MAG TPA: methanogenesis marker protein Mmp4/MtxX [Methanotrichaceae archaeon]|nr:methanogenesis marker protein Mmp4/MtxX [Methanotrichaceae archaeon]
MDSSNVSRLEEQARKSRARIGIGLWKADADLLKSLHEAAEFAELVLVGDACVSGLECIPSEQPWNDLVRLLAEGKIDGAVRGNLPAGRTMRALAEEFDIKVRRLALLELSGWAFFFGPVGIDEGETISDRLGLILEGAKYLGRMGISPSVSVLSGGRMEDLGRSERVDRSLAEAEFIAARARESGIEAKHKGILIESCRGDDMIIAPEGVSGNLVFRTLLLLCGANSLGAPVLMDKVFVDSSRARGNFNGPVMLASAMAGMTKD